MHQSESESSSERAMKVDDSSDEATDNILILTKNEDEASSQPKQNSSQISQNNNCQQQKLLRVPLGMAGPKVKQLQCAKVIQILYLNMQIAAKVFVGETYQAFVRRVVYIMAADDEKFAAFLPVSKIIPLDPNKYASQEEGKKPKRAASNKKGSSKIGAVVPESADELESGTPCSFNRRDLAQQLSDLQDDQVYYLVYMRPKTQLELNQDQNNLDSFCSPKSGNSRRISPRKKILSVFQRSGIKIQDSYEKPQRTRGGKKSLFCPFVECLREFQETGNLKTHLRIHTGERPFVCGFEDCGKRFITKGHLKTHELIHTGDKPFICDICGKSYSRTGRLKIHKRTHAGEKPFMCDFPGCSKKFTEKGNLKTHKRIHNGEKPFMCTYNGCDRAFTTHGHLSDHFRRHTGERPFKCDACSQSFMRSSTLKIHMRRHTGEKPFECTVCSKKFAESGNLRTHRKIHINALPDSAIQDKNFSSAAKLATMGSLRMAMDGSSSSHHAQQQEMCKSRLVTKLNNSRVAHNRQQQQAEQQSQMIQQQIVASAVQQQQQQPTKTLTRLFHETIDGAEAIQLGQKRQKLPDQEVQSPAFMPNDRFELLRLEEQRPQMTFATPQLYGQGAAIDTNNNVTALRRTDSATQSTMVQQQTTAQQMAQQQAKQQIIIKASTSNTNQAQQQQQPQPQQLFAVSQSLLSGSNQSICAQNQSVSKSIHSASSLQASVHVQHQGTQGTLSDLRNSKASQKHSGILQNQVVERQFVAPETEPGAKEARQIHNSMGKDVVKKANTVEYPKEGSPQEARHDKRTSFNIITPSNAIELAKISQRSSERMLIENAEPGILMSRQGSNPNVFNALNALSQLAQKGLQNQLMSSLQKVTETPEYRYEFSPRMAPTTNLANNVNAAAAVQQQAAIAVHQNNNLKQQNTNTGSSLNNIHNQNQQQIANNVNTLSSVNNQQHMFNLQSRLPQQVQNPIQQHQPQATTVSGSQANTTIPTEIIQKLIPHHSYADVFNSVEITPREVTPSSGCLHQSMYQNSYKAESSMKIKQYDIMTSNHQASQLQIHHQLRSEGRQFEDQISTHDLQHQGSFNNNNTASFQQNYSGMKKVEQTTLNPNEKLMTIGQSEDTSKISFMNKNMSLNSNFQMKTPQEGSLTRHINSFQNPRQPSQGLTKLQIPPTQGGQPAFYSNLNQSPGGDCFIQRSPPKPNTAHVSQNLSIKPYQVTPSDTHPSESSQPPPLPPQMNRANQIPSSFGSVGAMAMAKLMQHHATMGNLQRQPSSGQQQPVPSPAPVSNSAVNLRLTLTQMQDSCSTANNNKSPTSSKAVQQQQQTFLDNKSPTILPTPLNAGNNQKNQFLFHQQTRNHGSSIQKPNESSQDLVTPLANLNNSLRQQQYTTQQSLLQRHPISFDQQPRQQNFFAISPMMLTESQRQPQDNLLETYNTAACNNIGGGGLAGQLINQLQGSVHNQPQQLHQQNIGNNSILPRKISSINVNTMQMNCNSMDREKELEVDSLNIYTIPYHTQLDKNLHP